MEACRDAWRAGEKRSSRVDQQPAPADRRASQYNFELHGFPVGKGDFDDPGLLPEYEGRFHDITEFGLPAGVLDLAFVDDTCGRALVGWKIGKGYAKADPLLA